MLVRVFVAGLETTVDGGPPTCTLICSRVVHCLIEMRFFAKRKSGDVVLLDMQKYSYVASKCVFTHCCRTVPRLLALVLGTWASQGG